MVNMMLAQTVSGIGLRSSSSCLVEVKVTLAAGPLQYDTLNFEDRERRQGRGGL
jgi:hypothetical protein